MIGKNSLSKNNIYEKDSVFGDDSKFGNNSDRFEKMMKLIETLKQSPKNIVDLGCGTGFFANALTTVFPEASVTGIDISKKALAIGKKKYQHIHFMYADAESKLPFKNDYFDLVIAGETIEHLVDTDTFLSEINRITKKGGMLLLTTPNLASWINRSLLLFGKQPFKTEASLRVTIPIFTLFGYTFPENLSTPAVGHLRVLTLDMLKKLLRIYGFQTIRIVGRTMLTKPLLRKIDELFSVIPSLACGIIVLAEKI